MSVVSDLGFARGSADKLARRPFDNAPPKGVGKGSLKTYQTWYRKGYAETTPLNGDASGAGLEFGFQGSATFASPPSGTSSPPAGSEGNADQGFDATLPPPPPPKKIYIAPVALAKPRFAVNQKQAASAFVAPADVPQPLNQGMVNQTMPTSLATPPGAELASAPVATFAEKAKSWFAENWPYVAAGTGVVVVGAIVVSHMKKSHAAPAAG